MMRWYTVLSFESDRRMATIRSIEATADKDPVTRGAIAPNGVWYGRFGDDNMVSSIYLYPSMDCEVFGLHSLRNGRVYSTRAV